MSSEARRPPTADDGEFKAELVALIPFMRAFARSLCGDATEADDLSQESLLKAWTARKSYTQGTNLKAWAFTILRNHFYSQKRRAWRQVAWDQDKAERTLICASDPTAAIELDELRRALHKLPDVQRDAIVLVGAGGFSYQEAAEICGCVEGTIKSRVSRARASLAMLLDTGDLAPAASDGIYAHQALEAISDSVKRIVSKAAAGRGSEPVDDVEATRPTQRRALGGRHRRPVAARAGENVPEPDRSECVI